MSILIDGSLGEGGGQILRTSLGLSLATGEPLLIENIRANRKQPGLRPQHLTAVKAAAEVGSAEVKGAAVGARWLSFTPGRVQPGEYHFDIGTAGSTTLVLQTVLPPLMIASAPSCLVIEGGTHNPMAPPVDFLQRVFLPLVARMGPEVELSLVRHGFYPAGGGRIAARIAPAQAMRRLELVERGRVVSRRIRAVVANLPEHIGRREADTARRKLGWEAKCISIESVDSHSPGNYVTLLAECEHATELFTGFGEIRVPAEKVAARAAIKARKWLDAGVPVGEHLADQLLIPLALAGGGRYRTLEPTLHTRTNVEVIRRFLDVEIAAEEAEPGVWEVRVG